LGNGVGGRKDVWSGACTTFISQAQQRGRDCQAFARPEPISPLSPTLSPKHHARSVLLRGSAWARKQWVTKTSNRRRSATSYKRRGAPVLPRNDETRLREAVVDRRS
jgi:hypothetical protein